MLRYIILGLLLVPVVWLCMVGDSRRRRAAKTDAAPDESERPAA